VISNIIEDGKGNRRARRRRGVLAHQQLVRRCAAGGQPVARPRTAAAQRWRSTSFLNCYTGYDTLPEETKKRIDGRMMIHAATHSSASKAHKGFEKVDDVSRVPGARQPMVRTHPETGKKALFRGRRINAYVIGLPVAESEELLDELWTHTTQEKFTWTQEWKVGDLVWWDNRCALHRTQLKGYLPRLTHQRPKLNSDGSPKTGQATVAA
jgi:taurine dioxygenase